MTTRTLGYSLLSLGLFMGFFRITTDPLLLTSVSFSVAIAGALLLTNPYRLRWLVLAFLAPAAAFGLRPLILTPKHFYRFLGLARLRFLSGRSSLRHESSELASSTTLLTAITATPNDVTADLG